MSDIVQTVQKRLFAMQDLEYKAFQAKLMPTIEEGHIIGVRTPNVRRLAKELSLEKNSDMEVFIRTLPHAYYEENNLHAFLIEGIKDYEWCIAELDAFLPYVDNWATCDSMAPKILKKHLLELEEKIRKWISEEHAYTIRYGIGMLMRFYLDEAFEVRYLEMVSDIQSKEYYVNMMIAWYFATALAKQWDATIPYIEKETLDNWTHNKAIQKALESNRITAEQKAYLRTLKIKRGK
ncbi:MAG: DNA alkylation repair protein [Eubacteriales bacterium]|nr:DNA alkylation repair protein [Eubacteriales bacterium]